MKKLLSLLLVAGVSLTNNSFACSQLSHEFNGVGTYAARSFDFCTEVKTTMVVYPRGTKGESNKSGQNVISWVGKYGYVTVNQPSLGPELTSEGLNEKGLAVHMLYMGDTKQAPIDKSKPVISTFMWTQYVLANYQTVDEVLKHINEYQIHTYPLKFGNESIVFPLHFAIEDKSGDNAIIEFINGKLTIHKNQKMSIMTNEPNYDAQLANLKKVKASSQYTIEQLPGGAEPENRFVRANYINENLPQASNSNMAVNYMFGAINSTMVPFFANYQEGCKRLNDPAGSASDAWPTQWMSVTDLDKSTLYVTNTLVGNRIWVNLNNFNLKAGQPVKTIDTSRADITGDVSKLLK
ncbi:MAG: linear amide C-N hydrolase [Burkholderiales bacterium]|nr:linear amide C-N hydrolase [Burkholderiales bacterium]